MVLITDPFEANKVGLSYPKQKADIVTVSHDHSDHNVVENITGALKREEVFVIDQAGEYEVGGMEVSAVGLYHDKKRGRERGVSLAMIIRADGVSVCHLGDLGHDLTNKQVNLLGDIDVLLIPIGGVYTIDEKEAGILMNKLGASMVIPMHYKRKGMGKEFKDLSTVEDFLDKNNLSVGEKLDKIKVNPSDLSENVQVVVMNDRS